jgi:gas vesicle protein
MYRTLERQTENGQGARDLAARIAALQARGDAVSEDERALITALSAQLSAARRAEELRDRFFTTMERMVAELGTIDSEILGMSASEAATSQRQVAGQLRDLRELVSGLAGDMQRSQAETPAL